jgi:hypothetical protein
MKTILGYECQAAMIFNGDGDSSTMWIARNINPDLITFHHYFIVPGIVMESLNLKHGLYYKAVKVEKTYNNNKPPSIILIRICSTFQFQT